MHRHQQPCIVVTSRNFYTGALLQFLDLRHGYVRNKIIPKLFQCFISHVTTSEII